MERLKYWTEQNDGQLPENIIFYRDGVGETQFEMVKDVEFPQIRQAFKEVAKDDTKSVKITLLVVGKRHNTRFYPADAHDAHPGINEARPQVRVEKPNSKTFMKFGADQRYKNLNLEGGLVVDSKIDGARSI